MIQRIITGVTLIAVLALLLFLDGWFFAVGAFAAIALAVHEELQALVKGGHAPVQWPSFAALAISVPLMMSYSSLVIIPILTLMSFCVLLQVMRRENPDLIDVVVSVLPMLTLVLPGMCLFGILDTEPQALRTMLLCMVFAVAVGGDTFAYFVGSRIGGKKLCPNISPNKTVAGAIGGLFGSIFGAALVTFGFMLAAPGQAAYPPVWANLLVGLVGGLAGQVGDLFASMVKRHCQVKDFGTLFPGHGGMMDRMDSIVFTAIIIYCYRVILMASF